MTDAELSQLAAKYFPESPERFARALKLAEEVAQRQAALDAQILKAEQAKRWKNSYEFLTYERLIEAIRQGTA